MFKASILLLSIMVFGVVHASNYKTHAKDTSLFVGTIGPLLGIQAGANFQFSYQHSLLWSLDIQGGQYLTNSVDPQRETTYTSIGASFFLKEISFISSILHGLDGVFVRTSYSYHDDRLIYHVYGGDDRITGSRFSHGVEVSAGIRLTKSWYSLEFIPLSLYFPVSMDRSGESIENITFDRCVSVKIGMTF